mgnify:CR=1 FL=1
MRGSSTRISKLLILLFISVNLSGAQSKYIKWIKKKQFARTSRNLPKVLEKKADKPIDLMNAYYALAFLKNQQHQQDIWHMKRNSTQKNEARVRNVCWSDETSTMWSGQLESLLNI